MNNSNSYKTLTNNKKFNIERTYEPELI
jgi:hypothetical protein